MHLDQADIMALSASQDAGAVTVRQLDTHLVSLKRQVRLSPQRGLYCHLLTTHPNNQRDLSIHEFWDVDR